ncbi:MAG: lipocalin family protein [Planctomycetes bacterium]|nr:lipocalin family protein [Planctomycetota bacterium]
MRILPTAIVCLALAAAASADDPKATPIEDGATTTLPFGLKFDVPEGWTAKLAKEGVYVLAPDGANPAGIVEEMYLVAYDRLPDEELDGKAAREAMEKVKEELLPGAEMEGDPEKATIGAFEGIVYAYKGKAQDGKTARLKAHVIRRGDYIAGFVELGYSKALKKRQPDITAILASFRKSKKPKAGATAVRPELVGTWAWISNFSANNGGGSMTSTTLTLNGDGTYAYKHEHESTNPYGAAWGSDSDTGTWSATETNITFKSKGGETATYTLEKRNHPKNTGDPMIVIDGKAFVTTSPKDPWK